MKQMCQSKTPTPGETGKMVGLNCSRMEFTELEKVVQEPSHPIDPMILKLAGTLGA